MYPLFRLTGKVCDVAEGNVAKPPCANRWLCEIGKSGTHITISNICFAPTGGDLLSEAQQVLVFASLQRSNYYKDGFNIMVLIIAL